MFFGGCDSHGFLDAVGPFFTLRPGVAFRVEASGWGANVAETLATVGASMLSTATNAQVAQSVEQWTENPFLYAGLPRSKSRNGLKLDADRVAEIRTRRAAGELATNLAASFGVSVSLVSQICTGVLWPDAPGPLSRRTRDRRRPATDRFWEQVAKGGPEDCWPWTGGLDPDGYGLFYVGGKNVQAIRFALAQKLGRALTDEEVSRHTCHNRPCCNPDHLVPGSIADNNADMVSSDRHARGEGIAQAKLSEADVAEIRSLAGSVPFSTLAHRFGVSDRTVRYVASGERWKHIPLAPVAEVRS